MESKSIYRQFYTKLIIATSLFIITLSFIFYEYARGTIYDDIQKNMLYHAKQIQISSIAVNSFTPILNDNLTINLTKNEHLKNYEFIHYQQNGDYFIKLLYPFDLQNKLFLEIDKNISLEIELLYSVIFMFLSQLHKNPCRATFLLIDSPIDCLEICKILLAVLIQSQILSNLPSKEY